MLPEYAANLVASSKYHHCHCILFEFSIIQMISLYLTSNEYSQQLWYEETHFCRIDDQILREFPPIFL